MARTKPETSNLDPAGTANGPRPGARVLLGLALVVAVYVVGEPDMDAPWIQGDEQALIAQNHDVTGIDDPQPVPTRWLAILTTAPEGVYQPLPLLSYALEWALWRDSERAAFIRQTDILLHGANAVLLWLALAALLARLAGRESGPVEMLVAWALALLWAVHPVLVTGYAADAGRPLLLAALFALLSLRLHIEAVARDRRELFVAALAALVLAMLSGLTVGWLVVVLAVEAGLAGLRPALRAARVYLVALVCVGFSAVAFLLTRAPSAVGEGAVVPLGDPAARLLLAVWLHVSNVVAPLSLSIWYPPEVSAGWSQGGVYAGLAILIGSCLLAAWSALRRGTAGVAVGVVWFWALLLPTIASGDAHASAVEDRRLYLPLAGLLLIIGASLAAGMRAASAARRWLTPAMAGVIALVALLLMPTSRALCADARDSVRRAERSLARDPEDPRLLEMAAAAYVYSAGRAAQPELAQRAVDTLLEAAQAAERSAKYFHGPADRAALHRRLSFHLLNTGQYEQSLAQAQRAAAFEPDAALTWMRLAHAYRALRRWEEALAAYEALEQVMPDDPEFRALRYTEAGDLLLHVFERADLARPKFQAALETGVAPARAGVGLARCEVLIGEGAAGFELAREVLRQDPTDVDAFLVVAMYHLRSHHWDEAEAAYRAVLDYDATHYEALRGMYEVCAQRGAWEETALAWQQALDADPGNEVFEAYLVWTMACADNAAAIPSARRLLDDEPGHRFANLALMLIELRSDRADRAVSRVMAAAEGAPLPQAREFERAQAALRLMHAREELPAESLLVLAALSTAAGRPEQAAEMLAEYGRTGDAERWKEVISSLSGALSAPVPDADGNPP